MPRLILCLVLLLCLARCGDLPEPFIGNPGATGRILAQPPTSRLSVPPPTDALLPDAASQSLAGDLASALQAQEVPAVAGQPRASDWRLITTATQQGTIVVPKFTVLDPQGKDRGSADGAAIPVAAWAAASPATLAQSATQAAPQIAQLLTSIEIARQRADPHGLYNRPAKVMVTEVTGAPGDGDTALTNQMRTRLAALGPLVQTTPAGADFIVQGEVKVVKLPGHTERVEIQWIIKAASGDERGRVVQLNEIPAGTLDSYWGDVAVVVATEASGGVNDVLKRQSGHDPNQEPSGGKPVAGASGPAAAGGSAGQPATAASSGQPASAGQPTGEPQPAAAQRAAAVRGQPGGGALEGAGPGAGRATP
jgi:hypothetical protein